MPVWAPSVAGLPWQVWPALSRGAAAPGAHGSLSALTLKPVADALLYGLRMLAYACAICGYTDKLLRREECPKSRLEFAQLLEVCGLSGWSGLS